jgi:long-chain acyl-CoA synthetase
MQESTAAPTHQFGTGSATIADIIGLAAERYGEQPAARFKRDGEWVDVSYAQLGETVSEIARGLIDLGLQAGDRVALLCPTRVDWTDHGKKVPGAEFIWIAVLGPDTPALGERENVEVTQSQVAATLARLVGEDFNAASPKAARPLPVFREK